MYLHVTTKKQEEDKYFKSVIIKFTILIRGKNTILTKINSNNAEYKNVR